MEKRHITLGEFIIENQNDFSYEAHELSKIMSAIKLASKLVSNQINKAGLLDINGAIGTQNVQGEAQQKLDLIANDIFIDTLSKREVVCGIASEENDDFIAFDDCSSSNPYVVLMDPLDGSSNIDVNVSVGTIFSIYRRVSPLGGAVTLEDFLQPGDRQVAAGYVIFGSSTLMVYSTGKGVNGFTLDPEIGTFFLSHPMIQTPKEGMIYSVNEGNFNEFSTQIQDAINGIKTNTDKKYSARYIGSLVADIHRNLLKGGIYMYPSTQGKPNGKLRLLYECNPIAFIVEQAGGLAVDEHNNRILSIQPTELHQRVPFFCGSKQMIEDLQLS